MTQRNTILSLIFSAAIAGAGVRATAQDLLGDVIPFSGGTLHLKRYVDPPGDTRLISMTSQPASTNNDSLFVVNQAGQVFAVNDNGAGTGVASVWFDYNSNVSAAVPNASDGYLLKDEPFPNSGYVHGGLRSIAFHPEFAANGKFYTAAMVDRPNNAASVNYLGSSTSTLDVDSLLAEWTYDFGSAAVDPSSYRELFRVQTPVFDHTIKQIAFNNYAQPGDDDYGLLYVAHGDGSVASASAGGGLVVDNALGKVLRVNPLQDGLNPYTTPNSPIWSNPSTLDEIFTMGHRNPHHISFALDSEGNSHAIVAEPGRDNIEEINVLQPGGNYGWSDREGTFVHKQSGGGYINGVAPLPTNEWQLNDYVYPAAQYDHDANVGQGFNGTSVAGGFVIDDGSPLDGQYIFADFGDNTGNVYHASRDDLFAAHTQLADGELPTALTQAPLSRLMLTLDADGNGTIDVTATNLNSLLGRSRNDVRFGRGPNGQMFISSKQTGLVYSVTNSFTEPPEPQPFALAYEPFAIGDEGYTAGTPLPTDLPSPPVQGLAGNWLEPGGFGSADPSSRTSSLDYPDPLYLAETGGKAGNPAGQWSGGPSAGNSGRALRLLATPVDDSTTGTLYVSWLMQRGQENGSNVYHALELFDGSNSDSARVLAIGASEPDFGSSSQYGVRANNDNALRGTLQGATVTDQQVHLFVARINLDGTNSGLDSVTVWLDPNLGSGDPSGGTLISGFDFAFDRLALADFDDNSVYWDEIRFGNSFDAVTIGVLAGDYNNDGIVNAADYTAWRDHIGAPAGSLPNDVDGGTIDGDQYATWRDNFGSSRSVAAFGAALPVPEPASVRFMLLSAALFLVSRRKTALQNRGT